MWLILFTSHFCFIFKILMFDILFIGTFTEMNSGPMAETKKKIIIFQGNYYFFKCDAFVNVYLLSQRTEAVGYIHNTTYHTASLLIMNSKYWLKKKKMVKKSRFFPEKYTNKNEKQWKWNQHYFCSSQPFPHLKNKPNSRNCFRNKINQ